MTREPSPSVSGPGQEAATMVKPIDTAPEWVAPMIRRTIWRVVWVGLGMTVLVLSVLKARSLVGMLVIALFFGIAMDPAVTSLNVKRGWRRGAATGLVFATVVSDRRPADRRAHPRDGDRDRKDH
jgi:hypothetical protein